MIQLLLLYRQVSYTSTTCILMAFGDDDGADRYSDLHAWVDIAPGIDGPWTFKVSQRGALSANSEEEICMDKHRKFIKLNFAAPLE